MHAAAPLDDRLGGHLAVGRVLDLNAFIGTCELALMLAGGAFGSNVGRGKNGVVFEVIFLVGAGRGVGEWADE